MKLPSKTAKAIFGASDADDDVGETSDAVGTIAAVKGLAEKTTNLFRFKCLKMAERLGTNADWHCAVMASESGFSPSIRNPSGGATGLIQFMPSTARRLGTTTDELAQMSAEEQLEYVEKYYTPFAGHMHSATDVYMATFMPSMVGRGDGNIIGQKDNFDLVPGASFSFDTVYRQNAGFDHNGDGTITNGEVGATVNNLLAAAANRPRIDVFAEDGEGGSSDSSSDDTFSLLLTVAAAAGITYLWAKAK